MDIDTASEWLVAGLTAFLGAVAFAGLVGFLIQRQSQRLQFGPVIRVDVGPDAAVGDWSPPPPDIRRDQGVRLRGDLPMRTLYAWIRNQPAAPVAVATDVWLRFSISDGQPLVERNVRLVYLEPGRIARVLLFEFPEASASVEVRLNQALYRSLLGREAAEVHGRIGYSWSADRRERMRSGILLRRWRRPAPLAVYDAGIRRIRRFDRIWGRNA